MSGIGNRIKQKRLAKGLTQEQLAQATNKYTTQINSWENGRGAPNRTSLRILADALGISVADLTNEGSQQMEEVTSARVSELIGDAKAVISEALGIEPEACKLTLEVSF